ncbi:MAG: flagellar biosynthetic protein FliR [Qipengyuania citrea]
MLAHVLVSEIFVFFLVFARVGTAFQLLPGFGAAYVSRRVRLALALAVTAALTPSLTKFMPAPPDSPLVLLLLLGGEVVIGAFLGTVANLLVQSLQIAGMMIAYQSGLANATMFNPTMAQQTSLIGTFLSTLGVLLIFVTDMHHLILMALADSYTLFTPGAFMAVGDFSQIIVETVAESFRLGFQLATPFLVFGLLFYMGIGLLARLMPQMQIFFIALPLQIVLMLLLLGLSVSAMMIFFLNRFEGAIGSLLTPG